MPNRPRERAAQTRQASLVPGYVLIMLSSADPRCVPGGLESQLSEMPLYAWASRDRQFSVPSLLLPLFSQTLSPCPLSFLECLLPLLLPIPVSLSVLHKHSACLDALLICQVNEEQTTVSSLEGQGFEGITWEKDLCLCWGREGGSCPLSCHAPPPRVPK